MKLSVLKKQQRQKRKEARKLMKRTQSPPVNNSIYTVTKPMTSFAFNPGTILIQPHTWLQSRLYKLPLKERLAEFTQYDTYKNVFMSFREETFKEYMIEMRLRFVFRKLLNAWLRRRMDKKSSDLVDPITLNPIEVPIYVYSNRERRRYVFEAESLNKAIKKNLFAQQYTVPHPKRPINILTNRPFSYVQLISIYDQLLSTRCRMEDFSMFRRWQFKLDVWKHRCYNQIYIAAIREELYNYQSVDGRDMLEDFIKDMMSLTNIGLTNTFEIILANAISWYPDHTLLQNFRALCLNSYEANTYQLNTGLIIGSRFNSLFIPNYPKCDLWDMVRDRMMEDAKAEAEAEAAEIAAHHAYQDSDTDMN